MSLLRLLTAGRSLVGVRDLEGHYRETSQRLLPKFAVKPNPFRATCQPTAVQASVPSVPRVDEVVTPGAACEAGTPDAVAGEPGKPRGWMRRCTARVSGWFKGKERPPKAMTAAPASPKLSSPKPAKPLVQAELSLDSIRVVRNDLSDSDVEVVMARKAEPAAAVGTATKVRAATPSWRLGEELLSTTRS